MKGDPEERAVQIGQYLVQSGATVRAAAQVFGVSKVPCGRTSAACSTWPPAFGRRYAPCCCITKPSATCAAAKPPAANTCTHSTTMRIRGCTTARATV